MKVKKIALSILSTLIVMSFALITSSFAMTPVPEGSDSLQFVSIKAGYNDNYEKKFGTEYQYSIFDPGENETTANAIMINRIGQKENSTLKRLYDAYCARADQGFNMKDNQNNLIRTLAQGEDEYTDTYPNRIDMNDSSNLTQIAQVLVTSNTSAGNATTGTTTCYKAILQLGDMFYTDEDDFNVYKNDILKKALNATGIYGYSEVLPYDEASDYLTEDEVKAIQQAVLWYFTNIDQNSKFDLTQEQAGWFYRKETSGYSQISVVRSEEIDKQAQALYNYLVNTAIKNAANNVEPKSKTYLYTNMSDISKTQPVIIIQKQNKEFDLALRKYISSVTANGVTTNYTASGERMPNVDATDLASNDATTADYKHRKDPITVVSGSTVKYRLVIYNEGEVDGRATIIKDRLPEGVVLVTSGTVTSSTGNKYDIASSNNVVTLTMQSTSTTDIPAYSAGTGATAADPSSEVIEIECKVTAQPDTEKEKVYTNIAC